MERSFEGSYESVKRYFRKIEECEEVPFRGMEVLPGTECQVDYGTGAWIVGEDRKRRKTHLFRVVLSNSRKAYSEVTFTQETECFLRALENAFRHFGGVPKTIVIDNLKAGVLKPCVYDPEFNPKLRDFATHYETCILPSRVRTPRHKGKGGASGRLCAGQRSQGPNVQIAGRTEYPSAQLGNQCSRPTNPRHHAPTGTEDVRGGKAASETLAAGAILDRLLQSAEIIPFKGRSYRLRNSTDKLDKETDNDIPR